MSLNIKSLGDVCMFYNGKAHEKAISEDGIYKVVNSKFVSSEGKKYKRTQEAKFPLKVGDVCLVMSDVPNGKTLAKCFLIDADDTYSLNQRICAIRTDSFDLKFLFYQLNRHPFLLAFNNGENQTNLRKDDILNCPLWVPPIPEQKRIVAILDQAFADIDKARANAEQNLKNARELFESYLQQVFSQRGEGWVETTIGEEIELLTGFAFKSKEYVTHSDSLPLLRGDNIVQGKLRWDGVKLWANNNVAEYEKYMLSKDDIVLAMDRTWVKAGMKYSKITDADLPALLVQRVARLRCLNSINSDYLYHLIGSKLFENYVLSIQTGLGVPHISGKQIQNFRFNKPALEEQKIEVDTLNKLANKVTSLEEVYRSKLNALDELKKSILQKAFTGELTHADKEAESKGAVA